MIDVKAFVPVSNVSQKGLFLCIKLNFFFFREIKLFPKMSHFKQKKKEEGKGEEGGISALTAFHLKQNYFVFSSHQEKLRSLGLIEFFSGSKSFFVF